MEKFQKKEIKEFPDGDKGVAVTTVLDLIKNHKYYDELNRYLDFERQKGKFIAIPGSKTLINTLAKINRDFRKFDISAPYSSLTFNFNQTERVYEITFSDVQNIEFVDTSQSSSIDKVVALPIYSAQSDLFNNLYNMGKYANTLIDLDLQHVVDKNLEWLKKEKDDGLDKSYRIIQDKEGAYLRAITSSNRYFDYNINVSVALLLLALQKHRSDAESYHVTLIELNQSDINVFFEQSLVHQVKGIGNIKFFIQLSNNELRREAFQVNLGVSIIYRDMEGEETTRFIRPHYQKSRILSIPHGASLKNIDRYLNDIVRIKEIEKNILDDLKQVQQIKSFDQIRYAIKTKVANLKSSKLNRKEILRLLDTTVSNFHELLILLHKIELVESDSDAKDYLRYLLYEMLTNPKK